MGSPDSVARYYESNTRRFLTMGGGGDTLSIHRHLWGPGVQTTEQAAAFVNGLLAARIRERSTDVECEILDMGCGVGGTMFHLADAIPGSRLHGITISETQSQLANRLARERGLDGRCRIHKGDFESATLGVSAHVIVAIESFVHGSRPEAVLRWAADHLRPDGRILLVDDFIAAPPRESADGGEPADGAPIDEVRERCIDDFRSGWRAPGVCTVESLTRAAAKEGLELVSNEDLTPLIRLGRPRDRVIALISPLLRRLGLARIPLFGNMIGGNALQAGLRTGVFHYRFVELKKVSVSRSSIRS